MFYDTSFYRYTVENGSLFSLVLEQNTAGVMSTGYIDTLISKKTCAASKCLPDAC